MAEITSGENLTVMVLTSEHEYNVVIQALVQYRMRLEYPPQSSSIYLGICQDLLDGLGFYDEE